MTDRLPYLKTLLEQHAKALAAVTRSQTNETINAYGYYARALMEFGAGKFGTEGTGTPADIADAKTAVHQWGQKQNPPLTTAAAEAAFVDIVKQASEFYKNLQSAQNTQAANNPTNQNATANPSSNPDPNTTTPTTTDPQALKAQQDAAKIAKAANELSQALVKPFKDPAKPTKEELAAQMKALEHAKTLETWMRDSTGATVEFFKDLQPKFKQLIETTQTQTEKLKETSVDLFNQAWELAKKGAKTGTEFVKSVLDGTFDIAKDAADAVTGEGQETEGEKSKKWWEKLKDWFSETFKNFNAGGLGGGILGAGLAWMGSQVFGGGILGTIAGLLLMPAGFLMGREFGDKHLNPLMGRAPQGTGGDAPAKDASGNQVQQQASMGNNQTAQAPRAGWSQKELQALYDEVVKKHAGSAPKSEVHPSGLPNNTNPQRSQTLAPRFGN